ncbi:bark storage protein A-like [Amaranthus tricolor]|uniref:bark storage protein A-like n=1 Tax=Amaranthus tricolor TaxID=29722 RepID=UPI00258DD693|nr:bark storage protein A-like [Amaranthus tricolor]
MMGVGSQLIIKAVMMMMMMMMMMVQKSDELRSTHPLHEVVDWINYQGGPFIGLVLAFPAEETPLIASGLFVPNSIYPVIQLSGRKFKIGRMKDVDVIYVLTGEQTVNAALTVQVMLQTFDIKGIVHYGIAGCTNTSMHVGDVAVPNLFAFTSSWKWLDFGSSQTGQKEIKIGSYNLPQAGENLLERIQFTPVQLFSDWTAMQELFWFPVDPYWYNLATQIREVKLQRCVNETACLPHEPQVVFDLRGSTANVFMSNLAYGKFLHHEFNISTVDEESAAAIHVSRTNGVPCIVFRGISDVAGGEKLSLDGLSSLAATNSFRVAAKFVELIGCNKPNL